MHRALLILALLALVAAGHAQTITQPAPFNLNTGHYQFSSWSAASPAGAYPASMRFYRLDTTADPAETAQIYTDYDTAYNLTTGTRIMGQGDEGFSFLNTSTPVKKLGAAVVSLNTTNRSNIAVSWLGRTVTPNFREYEIRMYYRIGSAGGWMPLLSGSDTVRYVRSPVAGDSLAFTSIPLPGATEGQPVVQVLWKYFLTAGSTATGARAELAVDNILVTSDGPAFPVITTSAGSVPAFATRAGQASASDSVTINGNLLNGSITVTAPANFQVSLDNSAFSSSIAIPQSGGIVVNAKVYVRLLPAAPDMFADHLLLSTPGAAGQQIGVSGYTIQSTNPAPHNLAAGAYSLMQWDSLSASGTYPGSMAFHVSNELSAPRTLLPLINDWSCGYNLASRPRFMGLDSMGIGFVNTGSPQFDYCDTLTGATLQNIFVGAAVLALKTTGADNIALGFNAGLLSRDTATGIIPREYSLRAQWRADSNASFQDFAPAVVYTTTGKAVGNLQAFTTMLPAAMELKPYVQVRWLYHSEDIPGASGQRPAIRLDHVQVSGQAASGLAGVGTSTARSVYPNPLSTGEVLHFKEPFTGEVYDGFGRKVMALSNAGQCATNGWAPGIYYLKSTDGRASGAKIIVR